MLLVCLIPYYARAAPPTWTFYNFIPAVTLHSAEEVKSLGLAQEQTFDFHNENYLAFFSMIHTAKGLQKNQDLRV